MVSCSMHKNNSLSLSLVDDAKVQGIPVRPTFFLQVKHRFLLGDFVGGDAAVRSSG